MKRVMILGQPGSGKSTLAQAIGRQTGLPVFHMDHVHWKPGWVERPLAEKRVLATEIEAQEAWVFEGGLSATYANRAARADMIIWLDVGVGLQLWRVTRRSLLGWGRTRPDLPPNCPERPAMLPAFWHYIWASRHSAREKIRRTIAGANPQTTVHRLTTRAEMRDFVAALPGPGSGPPTGDA